MSLVLPRCATDWFVARSLWICMAWVLAAAPSAFGAQALTGKNLLTDASFNGALVSAGKCNGVQGQVPNIWWDNSCWNASTRVSYGVDERQGRTGRSLKVVLSEGLFQLVQSVHLEPEWGYGLGVWLRSEAPMMVKVALRQSAPPYLEYGARYLRTSSTWTYVSVSAFSNGLNDSSARSALFMVSSATPGTLWVDDASLTGAKSPLSLPTAAVPSQYFAAHALHLGNSNFAFEEGLVGSLRIWDNERSQWAFIQPQRPKGGKRKYYWDALDDRVETAKDHNADLLMVLGGYAPTWASLDEGDPDDWPRGDLPCYRCDEHPKRLGDWGTWVMDLASRYKSGPIKYWEIWNEPYFGPRDEWCPDVNVCSSKTASGYRGTPEQLLGLQNEAARVIKKLDPGAQVVSSGVSHYRRDYLDYFLRIGGGNSADVIGYHWYVDGPPELMMSHILAVKSLLKDHGVGHKPLWSTETGISQLDMALDPAWRDAKASGQELPRSSELGPAYLARTMVIAWASGLGRMYHYPWDGNHRWPSSTSVIARGTNRAIDVTDAGRAYRQVVTWMVGKKMVALEAGQEGGLWSATLQDSAGKLSYIVWHPGRGLSNPWPLARKTSVRRICDLAGKCSNLGVYDPIAIDFRPVYLAP